MFANSVVSVRELSGFFKSYIKALDVPETETADEPEAEIEETAAEEAAEVTEEATADDDSDKEDK